MTDMRDDEEDHIGPALRRALERRVDPEVAARHVMAIHRESARLRLEDRRRLRAARRPRRAVLAGLTGALILGSSTGAVAASNDALPGDILYPVKRTTEQAQLFAASSFRRKGAVYFDLAKRRAAEVEEAAVERPGAVPRLVQDMESSLEAAERAGVSEAVAAAPELRASASNALAMTGGSTEEVAGLSDEGAGSAGQGGPATAPSPSTNPTAQASEPAAAVAGPAISPSPSPSSASSTPASPPSGGNRTAPPASPPAAAAPETSTARPSPPSSPIPGSALPSPSAPVTIPPLADP